MDETPQVPPESRFVDTDADIVIDPATLPENRELIAMLDDAEASSVRSELTAAFDRFIAVYARSGGPNFHGWTDYDDPENYKGPLIWSEADCVYRLALELEQAFPEQVHLEVPVVRWTFADYDTATDNRQFVDLVVSDLRSFKPGPDSQQRFTSHLHELFLEAKHLPRGAKGGAWQYDHVRKVGDIHKDAERLSKHIARKHCKAAAVLVVDDDDLFEEHRHEYLWPTDVEVLVAGPHELTRRGLAISP